MIHWYQLSESEKKTLEQLDEELVGLMQQRKSVKSEDLEDRIINVRGRMDTFIKELMDNYQDNRNRRRSNQKKKTASVRSRL